MLQESKLQYMAEVAEELEKLNILTFVVKAAAGQSFGEQTARGLATAKVLVAFCSSTYGQKTGVGYETYEELKYVYERQQECILLPVKLSPLYPPCPPDNEGKYLCQLAFSPSTVYIDGLREDADGRCPSAVLHQRSLYASMACFQCFAFLRRDKSSESEHLPLATLTQKQESGEETSPSCASKLNDAPEAAPSHAQEPFTPASDVISHKDVISMLTKCIGEFHTGIASNACEFQDFEIPSRELLAGGIQETVQESENQRYAQKVAAKVAEELERLNIQTFMAVMVVT
eukprot:Skav223179  [mRNA]  locus=scaffold2044:181855:192139:+ [translate_table: standard]